MLSGASDRREPEYTMVLKRFIVIQESMPTPGPALVGQAVGATGESPKDDRQDAGPTKDARRDQIIFFFGRYF